MTDLEQGTTRTMRIKGFQKLVRDAKMYIQ